MFKNEAPINILLVDDKPNNLLVLEAVLESLGLNLMTAHSGEEALKKLSQEDFAVILLDVRMPEMDGFQTATTIQHLHPTRQTPIIFMTAAHENEMEKAQAYAVGAIDYMLKPFVPAVLRTKVSILISLYRKNLKLQQLADKLKIRIGELEHLNVMLHEKLTS